MSKELVKERSKEKVGRDGNLLLFKLHLPPRKHYIGYSNAAAKLKINGPEQTLYFSWQPFAADHTSLFLCSMKCSTEWSSSAYRQMGSGLTSQDSLRAMLFANFSTWSERSNTFIFICLSSASPVLAHFWLKPSLLTEYSQRGQELVDDCPQIHKIGSNT